MAKLFSPPTGEKLNEIVDRIAVRLVILDFKKELLEDINLVLETLC